jgi:hypothetical protein
MSSGTKLGFDFIFGFPTFQNDKMFHETDRRSPPSRRRLGNR